MSRLKAGIIAGSPLCGLCRRECIQVTKVFDGCMSRIADQQVITTIASSGVQPYVFINEESNGETLISNLAVSQIGNTPESTVSFDSIIPVAVTYTDANGSIYITNSTVTLHRDVVLKLPHSSLTPYYIEVSTNLKSLSGSFISPNEISCRVCLLQVCKVCAKVDMLVPSYGYAVFPNCIQNGPCEGLNNLPLFPPFL